jgi:nitrogen fixation protein FixH
VTFIPLHFNTGHKHKYNERHFVGWRVLAEIIVVTSIVIAISAFSVIVAQRATTHLDMPNPRDL